MKQVSIFFVVGFVAVAATVLFLNPIERSYPEDDAPSIIHLN